MEPEITPLSWFTSTGKAASDTESLSNQMSRLFESFELEPFNYPTKDHNTAYGPELTSNDSVISLSTSSSQPSPEILRVEPVKTFETSDTTTSNSTTSTDATPDTPASTISSISLQSFKSAGGISSVWKKIARRENTGIETNGHKPESIKIQASRSKSMKYNQPITPVNSRDTRISFSEDGKVQLKKPRRTVRISTKIEALADTLSDKIDAKVQLKRLEFGEAIDKLASKIEGKAKAKAPIDEPFERVSRPFRVRYLSVTADDDNSSSALMMEIAVEPQADIDPAIVDEVLEFGKWIMYSERVYRSQTAMENLVEAMNDQAVIRQAEQHRLRRETIMTARAAEVEKRYGYFEQLDLIEKRLSHPEAQMVGLPGGIDAKYVFEPLVYYTGLRCDGQSDSIDFPTYYGESSRMGPPCPEQDLRTSPKHFWRSYDRRASREKMVLMLESVLKAAGEVIKDSSSSVGLASVSRSVRRHVRGFYDD